MLVPNSKLAQLASALSMLCMCVRRIGTAEVESALVAHPACAEAAVVGYDHPIKVCYCTSQRCHNIADWWQCCCI